MTKGTFLKLVPPPELQAALDMVRDGGNQAVLTAVQFRSIECKLYHGADWENLSPKPEPHRIHTKQLMSEVGSTAMIRSEFTQAFSGELRPEQLASPGMPSVFGVVVRAAIEVQYAFGPEHVNVEARKAFTRVNGIMVAWPFWREWVASSLPRVGIHADTTPFMTLTKAIHMAGLVNVEAIEAAALERANAEPERPAGQ